MRKNRFLLNLIAATAIGLSAFGCDSSSSGAVASTADITVGANENAVEERANLREYFIIGQRGTATFAPNFAANQSAPANPPNPVFAGAGDGDVDGEGLAQLYEITGISDVPVPNFNITGPGATDQTPTIPDVGDGSGTTGFHAVEADPTGNFVVGMSRAKARGQADDPGLSAQLQIFRVAPAEPLDVTFPPSLEFQATAALLSIRVLPADQGEFVSVKWTPDGQQFYASFENQIWTYSFNGVNGEIDEENVITFPAGANGVNNASQMLFTPDGRFLFAIDNANDQILTYSRDVATGELTEISAVGVPDDTRGFTMDRSNQFIYTAARTSGVLAGYRIEDDGSLTQVEVRAGFGPTGIDFGTALGDVDANPQIDQLYVGTYDGIFQSYNIDTTTGGLTPVGNATSLLAGTRNVANIEVEPTGRFILSVQESDLAPFCPMVAANPQETTFGGPLFANIDSTTNGASGTATSATPQTDANGRIVYIQPTNTIFSGNVEGLRIESDSSLRLAGSVDDIQNPFGLTFIQRVFTPPAGDPGQDQQQ